MKKLLLFTIALVFALCSPVWASNVNTVKTAIVKRSIEMGVDPAITLSIAKAESGYRHETKSPRGAVGVFQLMPSTARRMGLNPYSLDDNIKGGVMYYKSMYKMFGSVELALAAYNAGPGNVKKYRAVPPFSETRRYVARIMADYRQMKAHPDPVIAAVRNGAVAKSGTVAKTVASAQQKKPTTTAVKNGQVVQIADSGSKAVIVHKNVPLPMHRIEQARNLNAGIMKEIPMEAEVKAQSVAI